MKNAYIFALAFCFGILCREYLVTDRKSKDAPLEPYANPPILIQPIQCDFTQEWTDARGKTRRRCYIRGLRTSFDKAKQ